MSSNNNNNDNNNWDFCKKNGLEHTEKWYEHVPDGAVVPAVIGALGSVTKEFDGWIEKLGITNNVGVMQKTALLGTARILRKVLEM